MGFIPPPPPSQVFALVRSHRFRLAAVLFTALAFTGCRIGQPEVLFEEEEEKKPISGNTPNVNFDRAVIKDYLTEQDSIEFNNEAEVTLELSGSSLGALKASDFEVDVEPTDVTVSAVNKKGNTAYTLTLSGEGGKGALLELLKNGVKITLSLKGGVSGNLTGGPNLVTFAAPSFSGDKGDDADSAIDMIRAAYKYSETSVEICLEKGKGPETVSFAAATDLGDMGLVLSTVPYGYDSSDVNCPKYTTDSSKYTDKVEYGANSPAEVTIDGGGRTVDLTGTATGSPLITVGTGVTLTLRNITFKGLNETDDNGQNNTASLISVAGGHLIIEEGTVITGNTSTINYTGGGVSGSIGTITMKGGEISGNKNTSNGDGNSGGIWIDGPDTYEPPNSVPFEFTMTGGTITGNKAGLGGGITMFDNFEFTMTGGTISGNEATSSIGGGAYLFRSTSHSKVTMTGGAISGNTAGRNGGGVYFSGSGTFTMETGAIISGNTAHQNGGGVYANGTFIMNGGEIKGNEATGTYNNTNTGNGGGVYVSATCTFIMNGGEIKGNKAEATGTGNGGGVFVYSSSSSGTLIVGTFIKTGGVIYGKNAEETTDEYGKPLKNTAGADGNGHAVYVKSDPVKKRDDTADEGVDLEYSSTGSTGDWD